jgi:hypothetical protein
MESILLFVLGKDASFEARAVHFEPGLVVYQSSSLPLRTFHVVLAEEHVTQHNHMLAYLVIIRGGILKPT